MTRRATMDAANLRDQWPQYSPTIVKAFWAVALILYSPPAFAGQSQSEDWLQLAEAASQEIEDTDAADLALSRLHRLYIQWEDLAKAQTAALQIQNTAQRSAAHIASAAAYAEAGNAQSCLDELNRVRPLAVSSVIRDQLTAGYLALSKTPELAISILEEQHASPHEKTNLCEALVRCGYTDDAIQIANNENDADRKKLLEKKLAFAAAKAGRIGDTEKTMRLTASHESSHRFEQVVWCELAEALYKQADVESASKYAARVNDRYIRRTHRILRRIADGIPPSAPYTNGRAAGRGGSLFLLLGEDDDPNEARRKLETAIAEAQRAPVETTKGQFGPWNQTAELARIRLQYIQVAALYQKAGQVELAEENLATAEQAIKTLVKENSFAAMLALTELHQLLLATDDIRGLKASTAAAHASLWHASANRIVDKVLSSGDVVGAARIANRALSTKPVFSGSESFNPNAVIACLVEAEQTDVAFELIRTSDPTSTTASACERAGGALVKTNSGQLLLEPKWRIEVGPFQRTFLCIGAAIKAREDARPN